jgi:hypothetical protein
MSVIKSNAIRTEVVGHLQRGHTPDRRYSANVTVNSALLGASLGQIKRVIAHVPVDLGNGQVTWRDQEMRPNPGPPGEARFVYSMPDADNAVIRRYGVAFRIETDTTPANEEWWLQDYAQNTMPWTPAIGEP